MEADCGRIDPARETVADLSCKSRVDGLAVEGRCILVGLCLKLFSTLLDKFACIFMTALRLFSISLFTERIWDNEAALVGLLRTREFFCFDLSRIKDIPTVFGSARWNPAVAGRLIEAVDEFGE